MIQIGDIVTIGAGGQNRFTVARIDEEGRAVLDPVDDAPGAYQFSMPLSALKKVET
ncbi:hypothetical protein [Nocardia sp. CA-290969]|uniref:hypothetical protein n=1 Tax=Nocardia sp. CA-290969 TaxID=3239986 RepID=UPI003D8AFD62